MRSHQCLSKQLESAEIRLKHGPTPRRLKNAKRTGPKGSKARAIFPRGCLKDTNGRDLSCEPSVASDAEEASGMKAVVPKRRPCRYQKPTGFRKRPGQRRLTCPEKGEWGWGGVVSLRSVASSRYSKANGTASCGWIIAPANLETEGSRGQSTHHAPNVTQHPSTRLQARACPTHTRAKRAELRQPFPSTPRLGSAQLTVRNSHTAFRQNARVRRVQTNRHSRRSVVEDVARPSHRVAGEGRVRVV